MNINRKPALLKIRALITACCILSLLYGFTEEDLYPEQHKRPPISSTGTENMITLDIKGMDIVDVLKMLAQRCGINLAVGKNVAGRVTLFLKEVNPWDAFEITILANDLAYEIKGDIVNVMSQRDYELQNGQRFQDKKVARIIQLKYAKAADLSRALNQIKTNLGRVVVDESSNTLALIDAPEKVEEMLDFLKNTDLPIQTRIFNLNYAEAEKLQQKLQEVVTKGVGSVRMDERTNKIVVTDYPEKIKEIGQIIAAFDEKTPQVLIDTQIIEINPNKDEFAAGIDWNYWLKMNARLVTSLPAPALTSAATVSDVLFLGVSSRNSANTPTLVNRYSTIIDAIRIMGETKILSSPRLLVLNNQEAKILVGTKDAYITSTASQGSSGTTVTSQTVNFVDVGIKLYVTPTINRDGYVTMKIKPEISTSTRTNIVSQNSTTQIPIVSTSEAETTIMVKDGTTIIIAGLKKDKVETEVKKIPLLGDIPFVGMAFRNKKEEKYKTELVIFITPSIVTGDEPLAYTSLTNDKDIVNLHSMAISRHKKKSFEEQKTQNQGMTDYDRYKNSVFQKISAASRLIKDHIGDLTGKVIVLFTIDSQGFLREDPTILASTNDILNKTAIECIKMASPFQPFPPDMPKDEETFKINLTYE